MPATVKSAAIVGIDAVPVEVEVEELPGLPSVTTDRPQPRHGSV